MRLVLALLALGLAAAPALAGDHVRVILDTSGSMRDNDKPRLATLATLLLHDLANPAVADSFHVILFHDTVKWTGPPAPLPTDIGPRLVADPARRAAFVEAVRTVRYDAQWTHFYPGLLAATKDLEGTPGGVADRRVIVVVTDGVPTLEAELQAIQRDIVPRLIAAGIRVYFLAFGPDPTAKPGFFEQIIAGPAGNLGQHFSDPDGKDLLTNMIEIFARSFGYAFEPPTEAVPGTTLNLEGGTKATEAAAVVYWKRPPPPRLRLSPAPASLEGVQSAAEVGASYSLQWVISPKAERYTLGSEAAGATVAVLRPIVLRVEVRPVPPATSVTSVMARVPFPVRVIVSPSTGPRGDPGPVDLLYRVNGPRKDGGYEWSDRARGAGTVGVPTPDGRIFDINPTFPRDPHAGQSTYSGHLEIFGRRREATVGILSGEQAHGMTVYPFLALAPAPRFKSLDIGGHVRALRSFERACAAFRLELASSSLPHRKPPVYSARATVDPGRKDGPLGGATFTLDGLPVEREGAPRPASDAWHTGQRLSADELLGEHELCVVVGRPRRADPGRPADVTLQLTLLEVPYDMIRVIAPFVGRVVLAPPTWLDRWGSVAGLLATLLVGGALLWYGRDRPRVPGDLHFAAGDPGGPMSSQLLDAPSMFRRLCGLVADAPLQIQGRRLLGWVRPVDRELYEFRPARGVDVSGTDNVPTVSVAVHQTFRVHQGDREYLVRLEYR